jgi:hypothetical protein
MNTIYKISVVQAYINHMKGVTVNIEQPRTQYQMDLLNKAFNVARQNLDSINLVF